MRAPQLLRRPPSVRVRILAAILAVAAIGLTIAGGVAYLTEREQTLRSIDERLIDRLEAARAVVVSANTEAGEATPAPEAEGPVEVPPSTSATTTTLETLRAIFGSVIPGPNESAVGLVDGQAELVPGVAVAFDLHDDAGFLARVVEQAETRTVRVDLAEVAGREIRYLIVPVEVVDDPAYGVFVVAIDVDAELAVLESTFRVYGIAALATLAAIGLVGWFVAGRLLSPLRRLREAASRITAAESDERIPVTGRDDVSELTRIVNEMLDRLAEALASQTRLLDDVRHELKTPITIVRGHLELLDAARADDVEATRALALDELDRMVALVDDLATLAEIDRERLGLAPTPVDALSREVHAKAAAIPGHDWRLVEAAEATVTLDRARITQAWLQLADNAAKYSPAASEVRLGSRIEGDELTLWVDDDGPGIPRDAQQRIFERFGRVDPGRGVAGSGLGLPIVARIAEAHGGRVTVDSSPKGSRFTLVVPIETPDPQES